MSLVCGHDEGLCFCEVAPTFDGGAFVNSQAGSSSARHTSTGFGSASLDRFIMDFAINPGECFVHRLLVGFKDLQTDSDECVQLIDPRGCEVDVSARIEREAWDHMAAVKNIQAWLHCVCFDRPPF